MFQFRCTFVPFRRHIAIASVVLPEELGSLCFRSPLIYVKFISATSNEQSLTASYLINTLGFSPQRAASVSMHLHLKSRENPDLVIRLFENHGFSQAESLRAVRTCPKLLQLQLDPEKNLLPKLEFLKSKGILSSDIRGVILAYPSILTRSLEKHIVPSFDFLTNFLQSDGKFVKALKLFSGSIGCCNPFVIPTNINLLRAEGVAESHIVKLFEHRPRTFCREPHQFKAFVKEVKEMGFSPLKGAFVIAVNVLACKSKSAWARKSGAFKMWGWADDEILAAFRRYPDCMLVSENVIEAKLEFFVNKMGCKSSVIARRLQLLSLSLDKRIIPRGSIIQVLLSKGLVTKLTLSAMFECFETIFVKRYILHHEKEAEEPMKLYRAKLELPRGD